MSLTPTQLQELQSITVQLQEEFPSNQDFLWNAAIRIQNVGLGPLGVGGQPAFDALVADMVLTQEQVQKYQGRSGSDDSGFDVSVLSVIPASSTFPIGNVGEILYLDTPPNTYSATDQIQITPAGPNSVQIDEVGTTIARSVPAASGGFEVNNLSTGAGFERVLTASDLGGGVNSVTGGININLTGTGVDPVVNLDAAITGVSVNAVTLSAAGAATNYLDETGAYSVPPAGGGGAAGTINYDYNTTIGGDPGAGNFRMSTGNPANIAALYFSDTDADALDIQNILGTLTVGCHIIMRNTADNTQFRVYVVSAITDNAGWYQFNVDEAEGSGATSIVNGTEIEFEFFTSGWVQPGVDIGIANQKEIAFWNPGPDYWEGSGSLISINQNSPPLGGRLRLGTTSGYSTTGPQIMRPLGAADTVMDFVYASDPNNGFLQGYWRVAGEMHFGARIASVNTELLVFDLSANVRIEAAANFRIEQKGAAAADLASYGQLWVNSADDSLNYQTEAGVNFDLTASAGSPFATPLLILGDINTATPPTTEAVTGNLEIWDLSETDKLASFGFNADDQLEMINDMEGSAADTNTLHFGFGRSTNSSVEGMTLSSEASLILTSNSTATGGNAPNDDQIISMVNRTRTQTFLELGVYGATDSLQLKNMMTGQPTVLEGRYASLVANVAPMLIANPHGNIAEPYDSQIGGVIQYYGEQFVTAFPASRTMPVASGVFQINTDGAGTWERVLTTSDIGVSNPLTADLDGDGFNLDDMGVMFMREQAASDPDVPTQGQLWVRNDSFANTLMFTTGQGNEYEVAGIPYDGDLLDGAGSLSTTTFVGWVNIGPKPNTWYTLICQGQAVAPAADDVKVQLTVDTNSIFQGLYVDSNGQTVAMRSAIGEVVTNTVVVDTDGSATDDGTFFTITGALKAGATGQTVSLRAAKNADTGADGFIYFPTMSVVRLSET